MYRLYRLLLARTSLYRFMMPFSWIKDRHFDHYRGIMPARLHSCTTFEKGCGIVAQQGSRTANMENLEAKIAVPKLNSFEQQVVTVIYTEQCISLRACFPCHSCSLRLPELGSRHCKRRWGTVRTRPSLWACEAIGWGAHTCMIYLFCQARGKNMCLYMTRKCRKVLLPKKQKHAKRNAHMFKSKVALNWVFIPKVLNHILVRVTTSSDGTSRLWFLSRALVSKTYACDRLYIVYIYIYMYIYLLHKWPSK